ncbi:MAG: hypothetical protein CMM25_01930 [Rhodospirillaceae bacterium]|nr:hypothetical protein [Rhodospirillaceae bacterium]
MKNNISTLSYFVKRLKDNEYVVWKVFNKFGDHDPRKWTVMVNPGEESVYITCYINTDEIGSIPVFEIHDGTSVFRNYAKIQTRSMEVIIKTLLKRGIQQDSKAFRLPEEGINNYEDDNRRQSITGKEKTSQS